MSKYPDTSRMDPLQMTRIEAANVILVARDDLSKAQKMAAASKLDEVIRKQFPAAEHSERPKIARDLAKQLEDPRPHLVAIVMQDFYRRKNAGDNTPKGKDGAGALGISRGQKRPDQER